LGLLTQHHRESPPKQTWGIGLGVVVFSLALIGLAPITQSLAKGTAPRGVWAQWRGPFGTGFSPNAQPPLRWSESKNIRWKAVIPGRGLSTPIVWEDRILLTSAIAVGAKQAERGGHSHGAHDNMPAVQRHQFVVLAINRKDGRILWQTQVREEQPHESTHVTGSWASASPATDGERIYAFFGSYGLYCLDMNGAILWSHDLGDMKVKHGHGEGSSPVLYGDVLVVNWDHEGKSFVVAYDKITGKERWRRSRNEITSWSTPTVVEFRGKAQVIVSATDRVRGYDLETGAEIWSCGGLSHNVVASPVSADGFVYVTSSYEKRAMMAIRLDKAKGDVTGTDAVVWRRFHDTPYVPSPLLYGDQLCFNRHLSGMLTCVDAKTGATLYGPVKLPGIRRLYASPVGAAGRIYVVGRQGGGVVLEKGKQFKVLAQNKLNDVFSASPAVANNELYLRGEQYLYCIAEETIDSPRLLTD